MILEGKNPNFSEAIETAERINTHHQTHGPYHACGHDFWDDGKKLDFGDVIMCNICHTYFAKIKYIPWLIKGKQYKSFSSMPHTNHCMDMFYAPIPARVTEEC